jgi:hypothetical protein
MEIKAKVIGSVGVCKEREIASVLIYVSLSQSFIHGDGGYHEPGTNGRFSCVGYCGVPGIIGGVSDSKAS